MKGKIWLSLLCLAMLLTLSACEEVLTPDILNSTQRPVISSSKPVSMEDKSTQDEILKDLASKGVWHNSPVLGSGYNERLALRPDGSYIYAASQMDGLSRLRFASGNWYISGQRLNLQQTQEIHWVAGELVPGYASWGTMEVIEGAQTVAIDLPNPIYRSLQLTGAYQDVEVNNRWSIEINAGRFWQLSGAQDLIDLEKDYKGALAEATHLTRDKGKIAEAGNWQTSNKGDPRHDEALGETSISLKLNNKSLGINEQGHYEYAYRHFDQLSDLWRIEVARGQAYRNQDFLILLATYEGEYQTLSYQEPAYLIPSSQTNREQAMILLIEDSDLVTLNLDGSYLYGPTLLADQVAPVELVESFAAKSGLYGIKLSASEETVVEMSRTVLNLLHNEDWGALGSLVHPEQGVVFAPYGYIEDEAVCLMPGDVKALGLGREVRNWGTAAGTGDPLVYSYIDYADLFINDRDYREAPVISVNRLVRTTMLSNINKLGNGANFVEFHFPPSTNEDLDWASLRLVFAGYVDELFGEGLYLRGIIHDVWTP